MMAHRSTKRRPRVVGVVASRGDLERAVRMRMPPDLFELRLDRLVGMADKLESALPKLRSPLIITARDPREGGAHKLLLRQRRDLLARFLNYADHIDVELRSASALRSLLELAENNKIRRIISFHDFKSTPKLKVLVAKAHNAKALRADIFKVATRTDTPTELGRLVDFMTSNRLNLELAVMGIGKLGAISRVLLARAGSALVYASVGAATDVEGQLSLKQLRALGFG
jgi:3-dehydroquinate dehydratase-1